MMTIKAPKAPHLADLLDQHQDEITTAWAKMSQDIPGSRYGEHSLDEVRTWLSRETEATLKTLSTGSYEPTEAYLRDASLGSLEAGFGIAEVIEGLLLFREAALPVIHRAYAGDDAQLDEAIAALDAYLRLKVGRFGHLYAQAMEGELRRSEQRFRTVADFAYDWEYWVDPDGFYLYVSPSCERITGYQAQEFQADPRLLEEIIHPDDRAVAVDHFDHEAVEGSRLPPLEFRVITRRGEERWLEHVCQPVYDAAGNYLGRRGSNRDATERKRVEEALAQAVRDKAAAAERSRLARELHDSVTQTLYSVNLHAEAASLALNAGNEDVVATSLQKLQTMTHEAMMDLRMLIFELHPPILKEEGLAAALRARLITVETRAGLQTEFQVEGEEHLPLAVAEELFWIAVEAFNNVLKHAEARKVTVKLSFAWGRARLSIADDGLWFDPETDRRESGMGLRSIAERVERIGGQLDLSTAPSQGTTVCVEVQVGAAGEEGKNGADSDSSARRR
jgi:PAS domain S-box-containing protein